MKRNLFTAFVAIIMAFDFRIEAQTNIAPIIRTNFVTTVPWFREVDGQLYNTEYSRKWKYMGGEIKAIIDDKTIVIQDFTSVPDTYGQNEYGQTIVESSKKIYGIKYVVQNYDDKNAAVGEEKYFKAMRVGTTNFNNETLELWDYGKPHIVKVITTNYPTMTKPFKQDSTTAP